MMELTFAHNIAELPKMLAFNYDELKQGLTDYLERFKGLVVTEDGIKAAEADRANINRTRDAIARARIDIKKQAFDAFETKAKELEKMCDDAGEEISKQLRAFEEKRKAAKQKAVVELKNLVLSEEFADDDETANSEYWRQYMNACWARKKGAWANAGTSLDNIEKELRETCAKVKKDSETLTSFIGDDDIDLKTVALTEFHKSFDLAATLDYIKHFKEEQKRIAEARARDEERKRELAAQEAARAAAQPEPTPETPKAPETHQDAPDNAQATVKTETYNLAVTGTREALKKLREYGTSIGITFKNLGNVAAK